MGKEKNLKAISDAAVGGPLYFSMGMSKEDFKRPIIGIANSFNEIVPGHYNLRQVAEFVKKGIYRAGGSAVEFGTIACCDGVAQGHEGMYYILPSRDIIADSIETMIRAHRLNGIVLLGSCDKIVPGMLMAAARCNIPAIIVPGGPMLGGPPFGKKAKADGTAVTEGLGMLQAGKITQQDLENLMDVVCPACGSCAFYGTANTMCCLAEALGMVLPGGALIPAVYAERFRSAQTSGEKIVELVEKGITARQILSFESIQNAIAVCMATGGSTNAVLHLPALAYELGIDTDKIMEEFDRQSDLVPHIASVNPASLVYDMEDFYKAGGIPKVMSNIKDKLNLDVMTVTGKTMGENLDSYVYMYAPNDDLVRTVDNPHSTLGGVAIMRGNLAPDTAVAKPAAIAEEVRQFTGKAICFDSEEECTLALEELKIKEGHVVVIRYEGPKGGPGMREMYAPMKLLYGQGLATTTALITDGRFSGTNNGCFVGHISPEAALGGPIALVKDGDEITVDVINKKLTLHVSDEELAKRKAEWKYEPKQLEGYLARYAALAKSADKGGVLDIKQFLNK
ncbi:MAG: dihydroxy-acid dehydratase [Eubacteriaceae bacterium]|jgi:dihydroxy-acid dehydratase|nr:dihydroxy-acid dehydratase [Eubacteriaceae bacterium]